MSECLSHFLFVSDLPAHTQTLIQLRTCMHTQTYAQMLTNVYKYVHKRAQMCANVHKHAEMCTNIAIFAATEDSHSHYSTHSVLKTSSHSDANECVKSWLEDLEEEVLAENPDWYKYGTQAYLRLLETEVKALPGDLSTSELLP